VTRAFSGAGDQIRTGDPHLGKLVGEESPLRATDHLSRSSLLLIHRSLQLFDAVFRSAAGFLLDFLRIFVGIGDPCGVIAEIVGIGGMNPTLQVIMGSKFYGLAAVRASWPAAANSASCHVQIISMKGQVHKNRRTASSSSPPNQAGTAPRKTPQNLSQ
jgi:hypothetical protein